MTADLEFFTFEDHQHIRVLRNVDGEPWFVGADVARTLGYRDAHNMLRRLDADERGTQSVSTPGGPQTLGVISEPGLYAAILGSQIEGAQRFKRWIAREVLPAIRKTGTYSAYPAQPRELPSKRELAQMVIDAEDRAEIESRARFEAESRAKELEAPASAWSHMAESSGDYGVADAAKVLSRDPAISIGRDRLFSYMAAEGWIFRNSSTHAWKAYQAQVDIGRLAEKLGSPFLHEPSGEMRVSDPTIRVTPKGLQELHKRLGGADRLVTAVSA
ncbi:phage antirepressor KilAC domain-containing protein [Mycobacterium sp. D16Q16]|uniref:phage antirepressor n=1 Tax=Mycobacterium sp. D16Q16 TaxID=1855659 RepID=UPI00099206FC|nr:phage antirepressor KilAC domain-containing protein [Mycobacterium sp. D16Q16]